MSYSRLDVSFIKSLLYRETSYMSTVDKQLSKPFGVNFRISLA